MRILRIPHTLPVLLLAGISCVTGPAHAAGPDFQYVGQDDRVHGLTAPRGCVAAEGGGGRAVTNTTRGPATLYQGPRCTGRVVGTLRPGEVAQVRPSFASVAFPVTG
ncbi:MULTISPECIES: hypothetical protein [Streptomyces]|uniref:Secreted protein n=1 Tax=Streptomyces virginiae TaxID=1961 RepID=A0ABQ3NS95_STRVG|nr:MULTISPECIES: hypothetical protein [Streptomyces]KOU83317.1 hypothetical protein ADK94_21715 [Streptomyces sp. XY593]KOV08230.1 hypothetical protein ADK92_04250 [Streptomyces sp. XY533]KOV45509.1 hypothetical protein ADK98_15485 [Streptomyces sp. H036]MBP2348433.1 hypothetical protein [Streptomyces virginiae]MCI4085160.1 hypothetical protein [Streptomyces sp. MMS21 TC-5]